jgi:hypothetical protein
MESTQPLSNIISKICVEIDQGGIETRGNDPDVPETADHREESFSWKQGIYRPSDIIRN